MLVGLLFFGQDVGDVVYQGLDGFLIQEMHLIEVQLAEYIKCHLG